MLANGPQAGGHILLFDVGVESVEQRADIGVRDLIAQRFSIGGGVQKKRLETIERFDGERDIVLCKRGPEGLIAFDRPLPLVAGAAASWQITHGTVERSGDDA